MISRVWRLSAPCHSFPQQAQSPHKCPPWSFQLICSWALLTPGAPIEEVGGHLPLALHLDHPSTRSPASGGGAGRRCAADGTAEGTPAASAASCTAAPDRDRDLAAQVPRSRQAARARIHKLPGKTHPDRRPERAGPSVRKTTFRPRPSPRTDAQSSHRHTGPLGSSTTHGSLGAHADQRLSWS